MSEETKQEIKKTSRGGARRESPVIGDNGFYNDSGDIANYIQGMVHFKKLPLPQTDIEVEERINLYFQYCIDHDLRPGIEGLSLALGTTRKSLFDWEHKNSWSNSRRSELISGARQIIAAFLEELSLKGKINPVTFIFLAKNNHDYSDKTELSVSAPTNGLQPTMTMEEIARKVAQDVVIDEDFEE